MIRQRLLGFMDEPNKKVYIYIMKKVTVSNLFIPPKLTSQNAVIIARIARIDYPHQWYRDNHLLFYFQLSIKQV